MLADEKKIHVRLNPPLWRHDAFTLRGMRDAFQRAILHISQAGALGEGRGTVVDFGAGDSPYKPLFAGFSEKYIACDLAGGAPVDIEFNEGEALPLASGSVDCVASFQVLEHVWDVDFYLSECRRLLQPNGRLLLSTHGTWLYHPHPADFRRWTRDGLCRELEAHGFRIETVDAVVGPLAWTTQFRTFAYHHVLSKFGPVGRALSAALCLLMYARMKIEDAVTPRSLRDSDSAIYCITASVSGEDR